MGQQPNAHFILMDQNQLSAHVEQDSFPLFQHARGTTVGEFAQLLRRVLTDRIGFDGSFADSVYDETGGHPFLTVNVLVELVEWLISEERPARGMRLRSEDWLAFAHNRLSKQRLSLSTEYDFFREAVREALSGVPRRNVWLFGIYSVLRRLAISAPDSFSVSHEEFERIVKRLKLDKHGLSSDELLRTGSQANFLSYDENVVFPKIRLLGRICATVRPEMKA